MDFTDYTTDTVINCHTEEHRGPWVAKQRVYQTFDDHWSSTDRYMVFVKVFDRYHFRVPDAEFGWNREIKIGTRQELNMSPDQRVLLVKRYPDIIEQDYVATHREWYNRYPWSLR